MAGIPQIAFYQMPNISQLPENVSNWKIDPARAVMLIHDMQRYFLRKIPSAKLRATLVANIALIRERCIKAGVPVAYTAQPGDMTINQRGLLKDFWGPGMQADPIDRQVVDDLTPSNQDWIFTKWRYSAFHQSNLLQRIRESGRDQLIICGLYGHIGVLMTAVEAFSNDIQTFIVADGIADFSETHHLMALAYASRCCATNVLANEVLA